MQQFRSLEVWKAARRVSRSAYGLTLKAPLKSHFRLAEQIRGAACSIPANLAEGYGLGTRPQLVRHGRIALASAYELREHIELASDVGLVSAEDFGPAQAELDRAIRLLIGFLRGLDGKSRR